MHILYCYRKDRCKMKHMQYISPQTKRSAGFYALCLAVSAGVCAGSLPAVSGFGRMSPWLHQYFSPVLCGDTVFDVFGMTFLSSLIFLTAVFLAGSSAFGQAAGILLLIYRGAGAGVSVSAMYAENGLRSVPSVLLLAVPYSLAVMFVSILAVRENIRSSNRLLRCLAFGETRENGRSSAVDWR